MSDDIKKKLGVDETHQKMYDELKDDHDGQSYVSNSDRKMFYKAVKKAFPNSTMAVEIAEQEIFDIQTGDHFS